MSATLVLKAAARSSLRSPAMGIGLGSMLLMAGLGALIGSRVLGLMGASVALLLMGFALALALQQQNHPVLARLLPGQLSRLRRAQRVLWLGGSLLGLGLGLATLPLVGALGLACWLSAMLATAMAMAGARLRVWLPLLVAVLLAPVPWIEFVKRFSDSPLAVVQLAALLVAGLAWWRLPRLLRAGDALHRQLYAQRQQALQRALQEPQGGVRASTPAWLLRVVDAPYRWYWSRLLQRASARNGFARLELVVNRNNHPAAALPYALLLPLIIAPALAAGSGGGGSFWERLGRDAMPWWLFAWLALAPVALAQWGARREQGLLALLPGLPPRRELARAWAWRRTQALLRQLAWVLPLPLWMLRDQPNGLATLLLVAAGALALGLMNAWTDWSRRRAPWQPWVLGGGGAVAVVGLLLAGWPIGAPLALSLLVGLGYAAWQQRAARHWPAPLPTGRR